MPNDPGAGDPLLRAIADCRAELERLIDEQVARLGSPEEPRVRRVNRPTPDTPPPAPIPPSDDPRQRLDALAKRLDGRLKRFGESEEERP